MALYLAIDVGGTKTDYVLADETQELARVRTGTIKRMRTDAATAAANLERALAELSERSGASMQMVRRTCVGTAGESVALVSEWLREAIGARVGGELILVGDVEIALDAAFQGGPGVLAMAGTGSNVAGRGVDGRIVTAGGWGPTLGDQGSGHRIGLEGLRAGFLAKDEGRRSGLLEVVQGFWGLASMELLVEYANAIPAPDFSRLTEVVLRCAMEGDEVAQAVLRREGAELGWLVRQVVRRVVADTTEAMPAMAFTGSILEKVQPVRDALVAEVQQEFPSIRVIDGVVDPIAGAVWRARTGASA
ncbi:MAG: ATPase [Acidobacteria bacterium]|nr:ATPase [Acidobacteriota bacterium]